MKIALVCSHGGHLTEMLYLIESFRGHDIFLVTYDSVRTRKLSYQKYLIENIGTNPVKMSIAFLKFLKIFLKERPDVVVSTGAEIAIPAFYIAKIFKAKTIFVECWCRVKTTSATGRKVYPVADIFLVQWPYLVEKYGKKSPIPGSGGVMIFVTVGLHYQGFDRLIREMDGIAGKIDEEVIMQIGSTKYKPKKARYFEFIDDDGISELFNTARITVAQAGSGTLLDLIRLKRPFIVVPRLKIFNEHIDDQQIELADALSESFNIVSIYDIEDLERTLKNFNWSPIPSHQKKLDLKNFLKNTIAEF